MFLLLVPVFMKLLCGVLVGGGGIHHYNMSWAMYEMQAFYRMAFLGCV